MAKGTTSGKNTGNTRKPAEPEPEKVAEPESVAEPEPEEVSEPEEVAEVTEPSGPEPSEVVEPQAPLAVRMERFRTARPDGSMVEVVRNLDTGEQSVEDI